MNQPTTPLLRALQEEDSDAGQLLRWLQAPLEAKPEIAPRLTKKLAIINHAASLLAEHKVEKRVVPMLQTIYGLKSPAQCYEILREASIIHGAMSQVSRSAQRKFWYDWIVEMAKRADESGDIKAFTMLSKRAEEIMGLDKEDPDQELLLRAEAHTIITSADPAQAGFTVISEDRKEALRKKYLTHAAKTAQNTEPTE
jgi:hypothetical protein